MNAFDDYTLSMWYTCARLFHSVTLDLTAVDKPFSRAHRTGGGYFNEAESHRQGEGTRHNHL